MNTAQLQAHAAAYGVKLQPHLLQPQHHRLWPEHWPVINLFQRCMTQWRATSAGVIGLDYAVVFQMAGFLGITLDLQQMDDLQTIEVYAREKLNRR